MAENGTHVILDEISGDEIQSVLDTLMGNSSISFMDYVASIIQGKVPFDPTDTVSYTHLTLPTNSRV